jgi:hypothetical protein
MNTAPRYNTITDTNITNFVQLISPLNHDITVQPNDNVYYFLRMGELDDALKNISDATQAALDIDPYRVITVNGWYKVDGDDLIRDPGAAKELYFLLFLGLAMPINGTSEYAIAPHAVQILYDDVHGLFTTGADNDATMTAFEQYLNSILLPAYYWRYHYVTKDLPADSYEVAMAARRMSKIRELLNP